MPKSFKVKRIVAPNFEEVAIAVTVARQRRSDR